MDDKDTIITVGKTEVDGYGNLLVTPQGGGDKIKIGVKRAHLHPLFEQGKAVILHYETYMNKPYVADAKLVEGELPPGVKPITPPVPPEPKLPQEISGQERGMWNKELGECIRSGQLEKDFPKSATRIKGDWYKKMSQGTGIDFWGKEV